MPTVTTRGAMSAQGYGFNYKAAGGGAAVYVEDVFSTYLYTGTGASQTITNNIDLATNGGLVWIKDRTTSYNHNLFDTARGATYWLHSNTTAASTADSASLTAFGTTGFTLGTGNTSGSQVNTNTDNFVSWTFRKQAKFFDIVTYTGTGSARTISHNLGSTPGMIIVKRTDTTANWPVYHSGMTSASYYMKLNLGDAQSSDSTVWNGTAPTSSVFSVGTSTLTNANTGTYVAYLFASDAGGFGLSGTDSIVSCGSYTGNGSSTGPSISLGWEPQFVLIKQRDVGNTWYMFDNMRGMGLSQTTAVLKPATLESESAATLSATVVAPTATGFNITASTSAVNYNTGVYTYIAIRRGPMKTPTSGTSVFSPITSNNAAGTYQTTNFPVDMQLQGYRSSVGVWQINDRLRGVITTNTDAQSKQFYGTNTTDAEINNYCTRGWDNTGFRTTINSASSSWLYLNWQRAPGFFDVVCYTGDGVLGRLIPHNLSVVPELIIIKCRNNPQNWLGIVGPTPTPYSISYLNSSGVFYAVGSLFTPTSTNFKVANGSDNNDPAGYTYIAYLFASCPGVSKVGSYTGTGAAQNIDCGFAAGARFVMIRRTDSTGDWYVYNSATGINPSGTNDPYFLWNAVGEVNGTDYLGTYSSGFALTSSAPAGMNANGGTYMFLAIA